MGGWGSKGLLVSPTNSCEPEERGLTIVGLTSKPKGSQPPITSDIGHVITIIITSHSIVHLD